jgi:hypothetical protein
VRDYLLEAGITTLYSLKRDSDTGVVSIVESNDWATQCVFDRCPASI